MVATLGPAPRGLLGVGVLLGEDLEGDDLPDDEAPPNRLKLGLGGGGGGGGGGCLKSPSKRPFGSGGGGGRRGWRRSEERTKIKAATFSLILIALLFHDNARKRPASLSGVRTPLHVGTSQPDHAR